MYACEREWVYVWVGGCGCVGGWAVHPCVHPNETVLTTKNRVCAPLRSADEGGTISSPQRKLERGGGGWGGGRVLKLLLSIKIKIKIKRYHNNSNNNNNNKKCGVDSSEAGRAG